MGRTSCTLSILTMIIVVPITKGIIEVFECPNDEETWNARASKFGCDATNGMSYHCIKTHENKLIEVCLLRKKIPPGIGGCPWVYNDSDGSVIFGAVNTICDDQTSCPERNHTEYYSDQLYTYPSCIRSEYETTTTAQIPNVTQKSNAACEPLKENSADVIIFSVVTMIFSVIFCAILTIQVKKVRKYMDQSTLEKPIPSKTQDPIDVTQQSPIEEMFDVDFDMKNEEERENDASKNNFKETSKSQKYIGRLNTPFMKDVFTSVWTCVGIFSTFWMFLIAGEVNYHGSRFNNSTKNIYLCSILLVGSTVLLCTICFCDKEGRVKLYGNYLRITIFLYQALGLNWILKQLVKAIFFAIENDENCNVESPFLLFICMALFYTLHFILCWNSMPFTIKI